MSTGLSVEGFDPAELIDDVAVVLLAGGSGSRLGARRPKAFVGLGNQVLLAWSLRAFEAHEAVDSIVLVVPEDWVGPTEVLVDDLGCDRVSSIEVGGASRAASVRAGLAAVADRGQTAVLVHDSARPFVPEDLIDRVLAALARGSDVVVPSLAVHDTVKRVEPRTGKVIETVPRSELRLAQTPQACRASVLIAALAGLDDDELAALTDCAHAVERIGGRVSTVDGDVKALKITTAEDLRELEALIASESAAEPEAQLPAEVDERGVVLGDELPDDDEPLDEDDRAGAEHSPVELRGDETGNSAARGLRQ